MNKKIKHVWFDMDGTLTLQTPKFHRAHDDLRYKTYAEVVKKPVSEELKKKYENLYKKHGSNSAVFRSLGLPSDFWQNFINRFNDAEFYEPDPRTYKTLEKLKDLIPVSIFTNRKPEKILPILQSIKIELKWFKYILSGDDVKERKPALDGFHLMIQKSNLLPEEILYIGDRVDVDIAPAKKAGIQTCLLWSKSKEANYSFSNFEDILTIFN